jgi:hypothetical protein
VAALLRWRLAGFVFDARPINHDRAADAGFDAAGGAHGLGLHVLGHDLSLTL